MEHDIITLCVQGIVPILMRQGCIELFSFLGSEILLRLHQRGDIVETTVAAPSASFWDNALSSNPRCQGASHTGDSSKDYRFASLSRGSRKD